MKLSESLRRGLIEPVTGGIVNQFIIKRRRITFFFEDILANYIKMCETRGYAEEMRYIGASWGMLTAKLLVPDAIKKLPLPAFSKIVKMIWASLGILEDIDIKKTGCIVTIGTKGEAITRTIGENIFSTGTYGGILSVIFDINMKCLSFEQNKKASKYVFEATKEKICVKGKSKNEYNRRNLIPHLKGHTLKDAIKSNMFRLANNRLYFRGTAIGNAENTLFHIIGNQNILIDKVPEISYEYFSGVMDKNTPAKQNLFLLKTLLQVMGWGHVSMVLRGESDISINLSYPPSGLQPEDDNWSFLINTILGCIWIIDKRFIIKKITIKQKCIKADFTLDVSDN